MTMEQLNNKTAGKTDTGTDATVTGMTYILSSESFDT